MKCLIFIFTLCSIGTFIDGQSETDAGTETEGPYLVNLTESIEWVPEEISEESGNVWEQGETATDTESASPEVNQPEESSEEDENNNPSKTSSNLENEKKKLEVMKLYMHEVEAGDIADVIGQNQHVLQSHVYNDLGRRSKPQVLKNNEAETPDYLIPEKAPPELVLLVAKASMLLRAGKDNKLDDFDRDKLLRSGNYWDGFWKEEVVPKSVLRSATQEKQLGSIKAKINPGTEFYKVVSRMKKISPKLLYIIPK